MIRPTWRGDDGQLKLLAALVAEDKQLDDQEDLFWAHVQEARAAGIPDTVLRDRVNRVSKTTMNRRLGARPKESADPQD